MDGKDRLQSAVPPVCRLLGKSLCTAAKLGCVDALRCANATPHVAQNTSNRSSSIDGRTIRHPGCATSQRSRKRIRECFGWAGVIGGIRKSRLVGRKKLDFPFVLSLSACNLVRLRNPGMAACRWPGSKGLVCLETGESGQIGQFPARRAGVTVLHLLLAARKAPSVGLFSTACQTNAFKYAA